MNQTNTLIVGASVAGLASAGQLKARGIDHLVIEKTDDVVTPWRNHYERLHLHTNKAMSVLAHRKYDKGVGTYPTRLQVIDYFDQYRNALDIRPHFATEATSIERRGDWWITETTKGRFESNNVIIAMGPYGKPRRVEFKGMESFPGTIVHSSAYKSGRAFKGQKVLVVGFGNSACELAIDLHEQGALPSMAVRSAVNVIPRDILGIPILQLALLLSVLPPRLADRLNAPLMRLLIGDIRKLGLRKLPYGPLEQIQRVQGVPVLDIGTLKLIRQGHIRIFGDIDRIDGRVVHFSDGKQEAFDAIVAAIGYDKGFEGSVLKVDRTRIEDLRHPVARQRHFGKDGLYFCGFWIAPTGQIREIARDAFKIATHISRSARSSSIAAA